MPIAVRASFAAGAKAPGLQARGRTVDRRADIWAFGAKAPNSYVPGHTSSSPLALAGSRGRDVRHRALQDPGPNYALPANSSVSVCTFTFSPSLMNKGTRSSMPVSSTASLVTLPLLVSPRTAPSQDATASSTWGGN